MAVHSIETMVSTSLIIWVVGLLVLEHIVTGMEVHDGDYDTTLATATLEITKVSVGETTTHWDTPPAHLSNHVDTLTFSVCKSVNTQMKQSF